MTNKPLPRTEEEWKKTLTPQQYYICRQGGTEPPGTGKYLYTTDEGIYHCVACGQELFHSKNKYDSGSGWPSFNEVIHSKNVLLREDRSLGMVRIEVICSNCHSHLGHLFEDPSQPTGKRY
ncbi:MAG: peptide-methionine (R)-S-oxide reductase [Planctomycetota bacterium]|nr:MAG: peptide-methionine (R)-S-oxide reductase [Planctomycetota bacterium]